MGDVFQKATKLWTYDAIVPDVLRTTSPQLPATSVKAVPRKAGSQLAYAEPLDDIEWLEAQTRRDGFQRRGSR
jgi:hypothetical protein